MKRVSLLGIGIGAALMFASVGCDVDVEEEGRMPDVEVTDPGQAPEVDVDGPDIDAEMETRETEVPTDIDVETETREIEVPDIDLNAPEDDDAEVEVPEEN